MCLFIFPASSFPLKQKFSEFKQFDHPPASLSLASLDLRYCRGCAGEASCYCCSYSEAEAVIRSSPELTAS